MTDFISAAYRAAIVEEVLRDEEPAVDDIVTRLRNAKRINWGHYSAPPMGPLFDAAADEIERLRRQRDDARAEVDLKGSRLDDASDEIERLRAAGDAMAQSYERALAALGIDWAGRQQSLRAWQEARRG